MNTLPSHSVRRSWRRGGPIFGSFAFLVLGALSFSVSACGDGPASPAPGNEDEEPATWADWLLANGNALSSLTSDDFADLQFLKAKIGDRRLVQLGESGHGVAQFNQAKVRLIKFFHQEMGFDVIAFESGIYECFQANEGADSLSATRFMYHCPFGVWHTHEVVPLFEYIKSTQATDHPLILAGFDIQPSSWIGGRNRARFLETVVDAVDSEFAVEVAELERVFDSIQSEEGGWTTTLASHADTLQSQYETVLEFFDSNEAAFQAAFVADPVTPRIARQTVWSTLSRIDMARAYGQEGCIRTEVRDEGMAGNVSYLAETVYPEGKILVWAHNSHIRHANRLIRDQGGCRTMGGWVANSHRPELYTVGLYMYQGSAAWNDRTVYQISEPTSGSLEAILNQAGQPFFLLDLLHVDPSSGADWIFNSIQARSWGVYGIRMVPRVQYDALLFIRDVTPPDYTY